MDYNYCPQCSTEYPTDVWPRACAFCGEIAYRNPNPVCVALCPVGDGLLVVERALERPGWALPGGFVDLGETWQEGVVRELREETGAVVDSADVRLHSVESAGAVLLVFGLVTPADPSRLTVDGVEAVAVSTVGGDGPVSLGEIVFPLHRRAIEQYLNA